MYRVKKKIAISIALLITVAVGVTFLPAFVSSQTPKSAALPPAKPGQYLGAVSCASGNCHGQLKASNPKDKDFRVRLDEYHIWVKQDRHAKAYNVLLADKAKNIIANMERYKGQKAQEVQLCLNCHALPKEALASNRVDITQGVSCESCHGAASGWRDLHTEKDSRAKSIKAGMIDLWSPRARAEKCLSCHLGTMSKPDQHVDHELIAAGHPDLKFELDNYGEQMPRHWASYAERANKSGREETEGARAWLVGQSVAFKMGLARLRDRARQDSWPEYAELDCYACHHSLQEKSWRQGSGNKGLPPWSRARFVMMRYIVAVFAPDRLRVVESQANDLANAVHKLGAGAEVAKHAGALEQSMAPVIAQLEATKSIDIKQTRQFVDLIAKEINLVSGDLRSAEQAVFAVNTLATDIFRSAPQNEAALTSALSALAKTVEAPASYAPANFAANLRRVQEVLNRTGAGK